MYKDVRIEAKVRHWDIKNKEARCDAWLFQGKHGCFVNSRASWDHSAQDTHVHAPILGLGVHLALVRQTELKPNI